MTDFDALTAFIRACVAEDRRIAEAVPAAYREWECEDIPDEMRPETVLFTGRASIGDGLGELAPSDLRHIARWDPTTVLAHCDAVDNLLDAAQRRIDGHPGPCDYQMSGNEYEGCDQCYAWNETTVSPYAVQLLGLAHSHRPGYQESWRPA